MTNDKKAIFEAERVQISRCPPALGLSGTPDLWLGNMSYLSS